MIKFLVFVFSVMLSFEVCAASSKSKYPDDYVFNDQELDELYEAFEQHFFNIFEEKFLAKGASEKKAKEFADIFRNKIDYEEFRRQTEACFGDDRRSATVRKCMLKNLNGILLRNGLN